MTSPDVPFVWPCGCVAAADGEVTEPCDDCRDIADDRDDDDPRDGRVDVTSEAASVGVRGRA